MDIVDKTMRGEITAGGRTDEIFRLVGESMPNAIVLADAEVRIRLVNAGAEKTFRLTREELIGRAVEMLS
ncbi:MAG: hypothetical protein QOD99_305 [Chthoniobacter sp.]|jgi:PAS domain S-box-containing protein|nr:hypothetical protein [Chthoniobacter sp.]